MMDSGCVLTVARLLNGKQILLSTLKQHMLSLLVTSVKFASKFVKQKMPFAPIRIGNIKTSPIVILINNF